MELAWGILTVIKMRAAGKKISSGLFKQSYSILNFQRTKPCHVNCSPWTGKGRLAKGMCKEKMQETNLWKVYHERPRAINAVKGMSWCPSDISMFPPEYFCWRFTQNTANSSNIKEWCTSLITAQENDNSDKELQISDYRADYRIQPGALPAHVRNNWCKSAEEFGQKLLVLWVLWRESM